MTGRDDGSESITVLYSCDGCGLHQVECAVRWRRADEEVQHWVEKGMGAAIAADHRRRSPGCRSRVMSEVMIPMTGRRVLGGPVEH